MSIGEGETDEGNKGNRQLTIQSLRLEESTSERISRTCVRSPLSLLVSSGGEMQEGIKGLME
jgi:hypothetical protein